MTDKPSRYASWTTGKLPLPELQELKRRGEKIVMVTAYDAPGARFAEDAGVDVMLVGDSLGMVVQGHDSTVPSRMLMPSLGIAITVAIAISSAVPTIAGAIPVGRSFVRKPRLSTLTPREKTDQTTVPRIPTASSAAAPRVRRSSRSAATGC